MITIILLVITVLVTLIYFIRNRSRVIDGENGVPAKPFWIGLAIFCILLITTFVQPFVVTRVDAGYIGVKVNLAGNERGVSDYTYRTGWVVYNEWMERLYEFPTFQQHIDYDEQMVITKGGFSTTIKPSFNYAIVPTAVGDMFQNLRVSVKEVEDGWLKTAIVGSVNDVTNKWAVDSIFNHREMFESAILIECNKRVSQWFSVSQLRTNIVPPPALQQSIEAKTRAVQEAQAKEAEKMVAIADGIKRRAIAEADSAAAVIKARGEAFAKIEEAKGEKEAIRLKQEQLSAMYIEYMKILKWDGKLPTTSLGSGTPLVQIK